MFGRSRRFLRMEPAGGTETVLIIEDEPSVRSALKITLETLGYHTLVAGSAAAAVEVLQAHDLQVDLLLCDLAMPDGNGLDLIRGLQQRGYRGKVLVMSGYGRPLALNQEPDVAFLQKPFELAVLAATIRDVLDEPASPPRTRS
jgi:two-component system, cell cycle sensor histidine kinase and response regulator CckA